MSHRAACLTRQLVSHGGLFMNSPTPDQSARHVGLEGGGVPAIPLAHLLALLLLQLQQQQQPMLAGRRAEHMGSMNR